jgi:DNA-directed RNA polymerase subunit beta'
VTELFEARTPKGASPIAEAPGRVTIEDTERQRRVILTPDNGDEPQIYPVLKRATLLVEDGQHVELGQQFVVGNLDPKEVLRVQGVRAVQLHLVDGVQGVYRSQGVPIHDKHIEVIVRQMLRKVTVVEHGDTELLPGELVDRARYNEINRATLTEVARPPRPARRSWESPRPRSRPSRGCRRPPSRRPPACSRRPPWRVVPTRSWASRRTSSSVS